MVLKAKSASELWSSEVLGRRPHRLRIPPSVEPPGGVFYPDFSFDGDAGGVAETVAYVGGPSVPSRPLAPGAPGLLRLTQYLSLLGST